MELTKVMSLPPVLAPRKGRLANTKRSHDELTETERKLAETQLALMFPEADSPINIKDLKLL
jgi:hypothetical protein